MMDKLEINDQFAVILFEDKTGGAWCKKVTGAEARLILGMASALNEANYLPCQLSLSKFTDGATTMKPKLKEHLFAKLVNELTLTARVLSDTQQLREWIARDLKKYIEPGGPGDEMTMDKAIKRRSADWSVSNTGLTGYIEGYNDCLQDHSDGK